VARCKGFNEEKKSESGKSAREYRSENDREMETPIVVSQIKSLSVLRERKKEHGKKEKRKGNTG